MAATTVFDHPSIAKSPQNITKSTQLIGKSLKIIPTIKQTLKTTKRRLRRRPKGAGASRPPPWVFVVFNVCFMFCLIFSVFSMMFIAGQWNLNQVKIKNVIKQVTMGDFRVLIEVFPLVWPRETVSMHIFLSKIAFLTNFLWKLSVLIEIPLASMRLFSGSDLRMILDMTIRAYSWS